MSGKRNEPTLRPSREATLGARVPQWPDAVATVPAGPGVEPEGPDPNHPDTGDASQSLCPASREAMLGGSATAVRPAGEWAPDDTALPRGARPGDPDWGVGHARRRGTAPAGRMAKPETRPARWPPVPALRNAGSLGQGCGGLRRVTPL